MTSGTVFDRMLRVIEEDIVPLTEKGVRRGDKVFGAAVLRKSDLSLVIAGTNHESECPLWHGEVYTIKEFFALPDHPDPAECLFLSTHEPCSMCLSAITWAGFDNFFDFFTHEDSRDSFAIPHDLKILKEVFTLDPGGYRRANAYWTARSVAEVIAGADPDAQPALRARVAAITDEYAALSEEYQQDKAGNDIPLN